MATFAAEIVADATEFLDTFGEDIEHWPLGDRSKKVTIKAVEVEDDLSGSREVRGDGVTFNKEEGASIRQSKILEVLATVAVKELKDSFNFGGTVWSLKRVTGRDDGLQALLVTARDARTTRREARIG